jgi:ParB-like chromosome segregation protein Spo0J
VNPARDLKVEYRPVASLEPYARNAKKHSKAQVGQIAESIKRFGWTNPVLVDAHDGIIAGHGRVLAAKAMGMKQVPVIVLRGMTEDQKRAYVLADNRLNELSEWDKPILMDELRELSADGFDLDFLDFGALDGDLGESQTSDSETPEDREDRAERGQPQEKSASITYPIYVVLSAADHRDWARLKGEMSDKDFVGRLIGRAEAVAQFLAQLEDSK